MSAIALPSTRSLCWHEAGHAASLCLSGMVPICVRVDWPTRNLAGLCKPDWERHDLNERNLTELLISVLQGPLSEGERIDIDWPIDLEHWSPANNHDSEQVVFLVGLLGLDRVDWLHIVYKAQQQARTYEFRALQVAIAERLEEVELVLQPELEAIAERVLGGQSYER